jgi:hypothetical protein
MYTGTPEGTSIIRLEWGLPILEFSRYHPRQPCGLVFIGRSSIATTSRTSCPVVGCLRTCQRDQVRNLADLAAVSADLYRDCFDAAEFKAWCRLFTKIRLRPGRFPDKRCLCARQLLGLEGVTKSEPPLLRTLAGDYEVAENRQELLY